MNYHGSDLAALRTPRNGYWYSGGEVGFIAAGCFVSGAACTVVLLIALSIGG